MHTRTSTCIDAHEQVINTDKLLLKPGMIHVYMYVGMNA